MDAALMPGMPVFAGTGVPIGADVDAARAGATVVQFLTALTDALAPQPSPPAPGAADARAARVPRGTVLPMISGDGAAAEPASSPDDLLEALVRRMLTPQTPIGERAASPDPSDGEGDASSELSTPSGAPLVEGVGTAGSAEDDGSRIDAPAAIPFAGRSLRDAAMRAVSARHGHAGGTEVAVVDRGRVGDQVDPSADGVTHEVTGAASSDGLDRPQPSCGPERSVGGLPLPTGDDAPSNGATASAVDAVAVPRAPVRRNLRGHASDDAAARDRARTDGAGPATTPAPMAPTTRLVTEAGVRPADVGDRGPARQGATAGVEENRPVVAAALVGRPATGAPANSDDASTSPALVADATDRPAKAVKRSSTTELSDDTAGPVVSADAPAPERRPDAVAGPATTAHPGRAAATAALPANGLGMAGTERIERLRQHAAYRPLQRLTVELDDARVAVRVRDGKVSVDVMSDPSSALGAGWARGVERTIERAIDAAGQSRGAGAGADTPTDRSAAAFGNQRRESIADLRAGDSSAAHDQSGRRDGNGGHHGDRGRHGAGNQADGRSGQRGGRPAREWFPIEEDA